MSPRFRRVSWWIAVATLGLAVGALASCNSPQADLPYDFRHRFIIPSEHAALAIPLTFSDAKKLDDDPRIAVHVDQKHSTVRGSSGNVRTVKSPYATVTARRDGSKFLEARYHRRRLERAELTDPERVRVFEVSILDYGGYGLLLEVERIPLGPDGARGEPVAREPMEQFDPIPLYRQWYARVSTPEGQQEVVGSYVENFAPEATEASVTKLLEAAG